MSKTKYPPAVSTENTSELPYIPPPYPAKNSPLPLPPPLGCCMNPLPAFLSLFPSPLLGRPGCLRGCSETGFTVESMCLKRIKIMVRGWKQWPFNWLSLRHLSCSLFYLPLECDNPFTLSIQYALQNTAKDGRWEGKMPLKWRLYLSRRLFVLSFLKTKPVHRVKRLGFQPNRLQ